MPFYAVRNGKIPGIYDTWKECEEQVKQFTGAKYKKFGTKEEAEAFMNAEPAKKGESDSNKRGAGATGLDSTQNSKQSKSVEQISKTIASSCVVYDPDLIRVYADGAAHFIGKNQQAGVGVYWGEDDERNLSERLAGMHTKNSAEIQAAVRAIEQAKSLGLVNISLHSDNSILVKAASQWMAKWKRNDWKTSSKEDVKNKEDFQKLDSVLSGIKVDWVQVTDKSEIGNKEAEKLAKAGVKKPLPGQVAEPEDNDLSDDGDVPDAANVVYTDGSCIANGKDDSRAGIGVYWGPGDKRNVSEKLDGRKTNQRAEIMAACRALQQAKEQGLKELTIKTDSRLVIQGARKWVKKWKENGWKTTGKDDVKNQEEFKELDKLSQGIKISWKHVRGHKGIEGNEAADKLANQGANQDDK